MKPAPAPTADSTVLAKKHAGGRPLAFKTVEDLQTAIDEYFAYCDNRIKTIFDPKTNQEVAITHPAPYTMSGLARRLGIDRTTLINYGKKDEFFDTIRAAKQRVEEDVEIRLMESRNEKGAMFNLRNNFNWHDEPSIVQQFNVGKEMAIEVIDG